LKGGFRSRHLHKILDRLPDAASPRLVKQGLADIILGDYLQSNAL
jgi:hypothetical protein